MMSIEFFEPLAMINSLFIAPSLDRDRSNGPETWLGIKSQKRGDVILNLSALTRALALQYGEGVRYKRSISINQLRDSRGTSGYNK
ncbi:MAG: hypothetical protein NDF52_05190 [archaeon YNP-WB-062]|jgi:hypothetical protein|nr:hypothetical protein [Candidatus Culexarchaeum yellowstonense]